MKHLILTILLTALVAISIPVQEKDSEPNIQITKIENPGVNQEVSTPIEEIETQTKAIEQDICVFCRDPLGEKKDLVKLRCGHEFHKTCDLNWGTRCALCRKNKSVFDDITDFINYVFPPSQHPYTRSNPNPNTFFEFPYYYENDRLHNRFRQ